MISIIRKRISNIINLLSGEINIKSFWKIRQKIINKNNLILLPWYYIRYQRMLTKSGASIPIATKFLGKPILPHKLYGIFISAGSQIGKNCVIFHQVTIGSNTLGNSTNKGSPVIGNNCYIGAGAKIIGNIKIGNNVRIGANCIVTEDIPDNYTVVLNKPRLIKKKDNTNDWIPYEELIKEKRT